ncbi:hypothetical protein [Melissospora conviva]|uniref:hypothetical protein n=1 Tax=Melissospora conviva TaxID=3388432 RepID=UPI003B823485
MQIDVAQVASAVVPYAAAMATAYGKDAAEKIHDMAVEKTSTAVAGIGERILSRILRKKDSEDAIKNAFIDLANREEDSEAAFRLQIRKALSADPDLASDVARMLPAAIQDSSGPHSIAIGSNEGVASTGDHAFIVGSQQNHGSGIFIGRDVRFDGDSNLIRE